MSEAAETETTRALVLTRLFIEAPDARDVDAFVVLVAEDAEFWNPSGGSLRGREAVERIVEAASTARVWLFRRGTETFSRASGTMRIDAPVVELVGGSEIDGAANFEVRDVELTAFAVSSEMLRAAAR
jgi:hypothetical protein